MKKIFCITIVIIAIFGENSFAQESTGLSKQIDVDFERILQNIHEIKKDLLIDEIELTVSTLSCPHLAPKDTFLACSDYSSCLAKVLQHRRCRGDSDVRQQTNRKYALGLLHFHDISSEIITRSAEDGESRSLNNLKYDNLSKEKLKSISLLWAEAFVAVGLAKTFPKLYNLVNQSIARNNIHECDVKAGKKVRTPVTCNFSSEWAQSCFNTLETYGTTTSACGDDRTLRQLHIGQIMGMLQGYLLQSKEVLSPDSIDNHITISDIPVLNS